jgi:hypothetical protein
MKDPRRLLDDAVGLSDAEREALTAARGMAPPPSFAEGSWAELVAKVTGPMGGPGGDGGASGGAAGGGAAGGGATKGLAGLLGKAGLAGVVQAGGVGAVLGAVVTTALVVASPSPTRSAEAPRVVIASASAPSVAIAPAPSASVNVAPVAPNDVPKPPVARASANSASPAVKSAPAESAASTASFEAVHVAPPSPSVVAEDVPSVETLRAEARLVGQAREALRAGNAPLAFRQLDEARRQFPNGVVRQEREALVVEALVRLGRKDEATRAARRFIREFPGSPFVARVKSLIEGH